MSSKPCKEIVLRKNEVPGSDAHYDVLVFGDLVGNVFKKSTKVDNHDTPKVSWVLSLEGEFKNKEFSSVKLVRGHMMHQLMQGKWARQNEGRFAL